MLPSWAAAAATFTAAGPLPAVDRSCGNGLSADTLPPGCPPLVAAARAAATTSCMISRHSSVASSRCVRLGEGSHTVSPRSRDSGATASVSMPRRTAGLQEELLLSRTPYRPPGVPVVGEGVLLGGCFTGGVCWGLCCAEGFFLSAGREPFPEEDVPPCCMPSFTPLGSGEAAVASPLIGAGLAGGRLSRGLVPEPPPCCFLQGQHHQDEGAPWRA